MEIPKADARRRGVVRAGSIGGHFLVSASACLLTVSIVGSAVVLAYRGYKRYDMRAKVRSFVATLENRDPQELAERTLELRARPLVAEQVLPELRRSLAESRSEEQLCAVVALSRAFVSHASIRSALSSLRRDGRERVAAAAVEALSAIEPPEEAAEALGECLSASSAGEITEAAVDEACAGLFRLGDAGLGEMRRRMGELSPDRRNWLIGYVDSVGGPYRRLWLEMLAEDADAGVRARAAMALRPPAEDVVSSR